MALDISDAIRQALMTELHKIETSTDLTKMTILSRTGMSLATAESMTIDADPTTASSAALIDVGIRFITNVDLGSLREILVRGKGGYCILMHIDSEYMTFAGLAKLDRIGYYLEYLRMKCKMFSFILAGGKVSEQLKAELNAAKNKVVDDKKTASEMFETDKSASQDMDAMKDVLSFLNDWGGDDVPKNASDVESGIVGIDADLMIGVESNKAESGDVDIIDELTGIPPAAAKPTSEQKGKQDSTFKIYEDEVPPVPLDDIEALEINGEQEPQVQPSSHATPQQKAKSKSPPPLPVSDDYEEPNFDDIKADEYNDSDMDLSEEDAMFEALSDLGYKNEPKKKKTN
jgi:predicted regulator of Ras-like GTPase activity (Roadblock/LC7/MglB family)